MSRSKLTTWIWDFHLKCNVCFLQAFLQLKWIFAMLIHWEVVSIAGHVISAAVVPCNLILTSHKPARQQWFSFKNKHREWAHATFLTEVKLICSSALSVVSLQWSREWFVLKYSHFKQHNWNNFHQQCRLSGWLFERHPLSVKPFHVGFERKDKTAKGSC